MQTRTIVEFPRGQRNYSSDSLPSTPVSLAFLCVMVAGVLRMDRAADTVLPWWCIPTMLGVAVVLLIGSYYALRHACLVLSVRLKPEGIYLSRGIGRFELVPWAEVKEVRGSALSREVLLDELYVLFNDGSKCPLEYPLTEEQQHRWLVDTARSIPVSVPIFPQGSPLARARETIERGMGPSYRSPAWILHPFDPGGALLSLLMMFAAPLLLFFVAWMRSGTSASISSAVYVWFSIPIYYACFDLYAFSGARYRTRLFFGAARIARIAPEGTRVLRAPYAGFRAWRPALLGRQGEVLPLTICGLGLGREQLLRFANALSEDDPARVDIERYLTIAAVWQPVFVWGTLLFCAGIYAVAIAVFCDAWWLAIAGAVSAGFGLWAFAQRFMSIYRIGREPVRDFSA